jgi:hypothetical protein
MAWMRGRPVFVKEERTTMKGEERRIFVTHDCMYVLIKLCEGSLYGQVAVHSASLGLAPTPRNIP